MFRIQDFCQKTLPKLPVFRENRMRIFSSWSHDMEGHAKEVRERYCEIGETKTTQQLHKSRKHHALTTTSLKEEEIGSIGELSAKFAHRLFWNVYTWLALKRPDILWSVNKLARAVTKWTKSLWQNVSARFGPLTLQSHMWIQTILLCGKTQAQTMQIRDCFQDSDLRETLGDSESTSGGVLLHFS